MYRRYWVGKARFAALESWLLLGFLLASSGSALAIECPTISPPVPSLTGLAPGYNDPRPPYEWAGGFGSCPVVLSSERTGALLYGVLHFPPDIDSAGVERPGIVIGPGSGQGVQANYQWLARFLAANGYVALTVDPQGVGYSETTALQGAGAPGLAGVPFQQLENYIDALRSGLTFLGSDDNPVALWTRTWGFGLAGHSLSARAASTLQGSDERVDAIVAMDNLSSYREGDAGIMSGGGLTGALAGGEVSLSNTPNVPRVPAMALASDQSPWVDPGNTDPELKKTGFLFWREHGTPAMAIVFRDSAHSDFSRKPGDDIAIHRPAAHYALAWFDWHLYQRAAPPADLLAKNVAGFVREDFLSATFRSAVFFPQQGVDCSDLLEGSCQQSASSDGQGINLAASGGGCTLRDRSAPVDLVMPALLLLAVVYMLIPGRRGAGYGV